MSDQDSLFSSRGPLFGSRGLLLTPMPDRLLTEDGYYLCTEDGYFIIFEGKLHPVLILL